MKIFFAVTHLLGTGHLSRTLTLARAFVKRGHTVYVSSGGLPAPHLDTTGLEIGYLPALRSDGANFQILFDDNGALVEPDYITKRSEILVSQFLAFRPDVLITELFPFGRRMLREEFAALLNAASEQSPIPLICASIRDILAPPSKPAKADMAHDLVAKYYDAVLVHADPHIITVDKSWPLTPDVADKLHYTGFVAQKAAGVHPEQLGAGEVVVTTGGGNTGQNIFVAALDAARLDSGRTWRMLVGGSDVPERMRDLAQNAPPNMIIEPTRPDFRQILYHADVSVSMCGYNTTLDLLQSGARAVVVPLDANNEVEQVIRSKALARLEGFQVIDSTELTPEKIIEAIQKLTTTPARSPMTTGLNGSERMVDVVERLHEGRCA